MIYKYAVNDLYKLINSIFNRAFISNNIIRSNINEIKLVKAQISKISRFIKINNIVKLRDFAKSRDIRLKEYYYKFSN